MTRWARIARFPSTGRFAELQLSELDEVSKLSQELLSRVSRRDWDEISELQAKREQALRACLEQPIEGEHVEATKAKIQELLRQNEAILEQVNAAKACLLDEMRESQQNHRAVSAYLTSAR